MKYGFGRNQKTDGGEESGANLFERYKQSIVGYQRLTSEQEKSYFAAAEEASPEENIRLRWEVALHNLPLVIYIAKRFGHRLPFLDRIQEGNIGILIAAARFELRHEVRFGTYAEWWIRAMIIRAQSKEGWAGSIIRHPAGVQRIFAQVQEIQQRLFQRLGREIESEEILSAILEEERRKAIERVRQKENSDRAISKQQQKRKPVSIHDVEYASRVLSGFVISFDMTPDKENVVDMSCLHETIADPGVCPQDVWLEAKHCLEEILRELQWVDHRIAKFHERSAAIVRHRLGLPGYPKRTLKELGEQFDLSRERIRQIERLELKRIERMTGLPREKIFRMVRTAEELQEIVNLT